MDRAACLEGRPPCFPLVSRRHPPILNLGKSTEPGRNELLRARLLPSRDMRLPNSPDSGCRLRPRVGPYSCERFVPKELI